MLQFRFAAESDTGLVRDHNEDSAYAGPYLLAVADGVGGAAAGEVASATTTYVVSALALANPGTHPLGLLQSSIEASRAQVHAGIEADPARQGMATTLTAVLTDGLRFGLAHVGDSRAYLLRDGGLHQLTHDHTLVQALLDTGRITAEEAAESPMRSVVLQAVDGESVPTPDLVWLDLRAGDRLLLCSDGLTDLVADADIHRLLDVDSRRLAATGLMRAALDAGGRDNVTCVVADLVDAEPVTGTGLLFGAARDIANVVDPSAIRPVRSA
jgi:serine/threonine protein phosphatase PrpC